MRKKSALALGLSLAFLVPTFAEAAQGNVRRGRAIAQKYCSMCHAIGQTDKSPKEGTIPFRDLHTRYPIDNLDESLGEGLVINHPDMPEISLSVAQIFDFKAYLRSLNK
ncbi:c-type cytochrome [Microvirga sp. 2TAF3]|uniref:c-type cytochrome n=1 Tax=Microvirga sp. 2TAF3 TaxID=3233014 RepID=UPI003F94D1C2